MHGSYSLHAITAFPPVAPALATLEHPCPSSMAVGCIRFGYREVIGRAESGTETGKTSGRL